MYPAIQIWMLKLIRIKKPHIIRNCNFTGTWRHEAGVVVVSLVPYLLIRNLCCDTCGLSYFM